MGIRGGGGAHGEEENRVWKGVPQTHLPVLFLKTTPHRTVLTSPASVFTSGVCLFRSRLRSLISPLFSLRCPLRFLTSPLRLLTSPLRPLTQSVCGRFLFGLRVVEPLATSRPLCGFTPIVPLHHIKLSQTTSVAKEISEVVVVLWSAAVEISSLMGGSAPEGVERDPGRRHSAPKLARSASALHGREGTDRTGRGVQSALLGWASGEGPPLHSLQKEGSVLPVRGPGGPNDPVRETRQVRETAEEISSVAEEISSIDVEMASLAHDISRVASEIRFSMTVDIIPFKPQWILYCPCSTAIELPWSSTATALHLHWHCTAEPVLGKKKGG